MIMVVECVAVCLRKRLCPSATLWSGSGVPTGPSLKRLAGSAITIRPIPDHP